MIHNLAASEAANDIEFGDIPFLICVFLETAILVDEPIHSVSDNMIGDIGIHSKFFLVIWFPSHAVRLEHTSFELSEKMSFLSIVLKLLGLWL